MKSIEKIKNIYIQVFYDDPRLRMTFYRAMARGLVKRLRDTTDQAIFSVLPQFV